jgi:hypothetical protein
MAFAIAGVFAMLGTQMSATPDASAADDATLRLTKECAASYTGTFTINVKGSGTDSAFDETRQVACGNTATLTVDSGVEYTVSEVGASGYDVSIRGACDGDGTVTFPFQGSLSGTCTIRNVAASVPSTLTLKKECTNFSEGTFTINVTGTGVDTDREVACGQTATVNVTSGVTYTVSETDATGYNTSIRGACDGDGTVRFPFQGGYTGTCVVSNTAVSTPSVITLQKECAGQYTGPFTINVSGTGINTNRVLGCNETATVDVTSGVTYTVSEVGADGYNVSIRGACDGDGTVSFPFQGEYTGTCVVRNQANTVSAALDLEAECEDNYQGSFPVNVFGPNVNETVDLECGETNTVTIQGNTQYLVTFGTNNPTLASTNNWEPEWSFVASIRGACDGNGTVTLTAEEGFEGTCVIHIEKVVDCDNNEMQRGGWNGCHGGCDDNEMLRNGGGNDWCHPGCDDNEPAFSGRNNGDWCNPGCDDEVRSFNGNDDDCDNHCNNGDNYARGSDNNCHDDCDDESWDNNRSDSKWWDDNCNDHEDCDDEWWDDNRSDSKWWDDNCDEHDDDDDDRDRVNDHEDADSDEDCDCDDEDYTTVSQTTPLTTSTVTAAPLLTTQLSSGGSTQQQSQQNVASLPSGIRPPSTGDAGLASSQGSNTLAMAGLVTGLVVVAGLFTRWKLAKNS